MSMKIKRITAIPASGGDPIPGFPSEWPDRVTLIDAARAEAGEHGGLILMQGERRIASVGAPGKAAQAANATKATKQAVNQAADQHEAATKAKSAKAAKPEPTEAEKEAVKQAKEQARETAKAIAETKKAATKAEREKANAAKKAEREATNQPKPCLCGCGATAGKGARFIPGHDAKSHSRSRRLAFGLVTREAAIAEMAAATEATIAEMDAHAATIDTTSKPKCHARWVVDVRTDDTTDPAAAILFTSRPFTTEKAAQDWAEQSGMATTVRAS